MVTDSRSSIDDPHHLTEVFRPPWTSPSTLSVSETKDETGAMNSEWPPNPPRGTSKVFFLLSPWNRITWAKYC